PRPFRADQEPEAGPRGGTDVAAPVAPGLELDVLLVPDAGEADTRIGHEAPLGVRLPDEAREDLQRHKPQRHLRARLARRRRRAEAPVPQVTDFSADLEPVAGPPAAGDAEHRVPVVAVEVLVAVEIR